MERYSFANIASGGQWGFREAFKEEISWPFPSAVIKEAASGQEASQKINSFPSRIISIIINQFNSQNHREGG